MPGDMLNFDTEAQMVRDQMEQMRPENRWRRPKRWRNSIAQLEPSDKELKQMRREIEKSMKAAAEGHGEDVARAGEIGQAGAEGNGADAARDAELDAQPERLDEMKRQIAQSMPSQKEMDEMKQQMQESMPSQKELEAMKQQMQAQCPARKTLTTCGTRSKAP